MSEADYQARANMIEQFARDTDNSTVATQFEALARAYRILMRFRERTAHLRQVTPGNDDKPPSDIATG